MADLLDSIGIKEGDKFIEKFQGSVFVIKCGGSLVENLDTGRAILEDIAFLKKNGIHPALVHGGSVQADKDMEAAGIRPCRHRGLRITCEKTIVILEKCFGDLNANLVERLKKRDVNAVGFSGKKGGLVRAEKMVLDDVDLGFVGDVTGIDMDAWNGVGEDGLPVIASLGVDHEGNVLNINADYVATQLALRVGAEKLILMTDVDGVCKDQCNSKSLIPTLTVSRARQLIDEGVIAGGMIPKVESAVRTIEQGLPKIHMINGRTSHSLLFEIFTDKGIGTQIIPDCAAK